MIVEAIEHQAPHGTFENVTSIPNGILGNSRTRIFIRVLIAPEIWSRLKDSPHVKDGMAVVEVRIRPDSNIGHDRSHFFGVDPGDRMTLIASYEGHGFKIPLEPLPAPTLLAELTSAQKRQPSLKST